LNNNNSNNNNNNRNEKARVVSVTIGENGTIPKSFRLYLSNIPGKHEIEELKKTATLGSAHILRKAIL
jgi:hypothetical protein